jgi:hypothetical protein
MMNLKWGRREEEEFFLLFHLFKQDDTFRQVE